MFDSELFVCMCCWPISVSQTYQFVCSWKSACCHESSLNPAYNVRDWILGPEEKADDWAFVFVSAMLFSHAVELARDGKGSGFL